MKLLTCMNCGASEFYEQDGYSVCCYCRSKHIAQPDDKPPMESTIALNDDVSRLLKKCQDEPANARRYASLILDIDPGNAEARRYL